MGDDADLVTLPDGDAEGVILSAARPDLPLPL
jgi:hypothetical protein